MDNLLRCLGLCLLQAGGALSLVWALCLALVAPGPAFLLLLATAAQWLLLWAILRDSRLEAERLLSRLTPR